MSGKLHKRRLRRSRRLFDFDRALDHRFVAGADEAGRGCLAGPLVAAAVLFDYETLSIADRRILGGLHDSKQMTEEARLEMFPCVMRAAARVSIVIRSAPGIDRRGLHVTNCEALGDALARLEPGPEAICLVDGFRLPRCVVPHRRVVGGDRTSAAIAAASVLAKVTRDRYMREAAERHPGWGFDEHVGYSTPEHRAAIEELGISPLHRRSFASVAYTQLGLEGGYEAGELIEDEELLEDELEHLEASDEVLEVDDFVAGTEDDADGVEADLGVARH
ncbi:MAG TPA: ribonuclease HII [Solirubrobacterales bacterium]|nr:ribonuclease HII [Solirubrobacterales bacterium]